MQYMRNLTYRKVKIKMNDKIKIKFNILAIILILIFCFAITPKTLQNDTYYTIKIGEHIVQNGIDMKDPFSWHEDLPYTYPHWAYDVAIYEIFNIGENVGIGGFTAIYISTILLCMALGVLIYYVSLKLSKNNLISFLVTLAVMYLLNSFIAARAQLVTYIIFVLQILFIEQFLATHKKRYAIGLIILPIIIANIHLAVWPFYFVLFMPYIVEYIIALIIESNIVYKINISFNKHRLKKLSLKKVKPENKEKLDKKIQDATAYINKLEESIEKSNLLREERRANPYKIKFKKEKVAKWLIVIMLICVFTGLLTPLGDTPYTYLIKTMQGNTMDYISEHLPITLINHKSMIAVFVLFLAILIFTDIKIKLRDLFMLAGLTLLVFMSRRQISMFVIVCSFIFEKLVVKIIEKYDPEGTEKMMKQMTSFLGKILTILLVVLISFFLYRDKIDAPIINESAYPVAASDYILNNLDISTLKMYNEYNYGSYLLYRGIPVFIDSRADLYTPEFNGTKGEDGKYNGRNIFSDYMNISNIATYYEDKFKQYGINYVMTKRTTKLNMFISRDDRYKKIYSDDNFYIYERLDKE